MASGANFDAEIRLDIGPFIASIQKAQAEVKKLSQQIDTFNNKSLNIRTGNSAVAGPAANMAVGSGSRERMAAAKQEIAVQEELTKAQTTRARKADQDSKSAERNLARERYALYDVAAAYTAIATAGTLAVVATSGTAINYERAFADVLRTTDFTSARIGAAAESAKSDLKSLASEIPVAFGQITQIATIGNQLGIAQGAITSFTETVAKFSATTGVTVDATAMAFGRIGELLGVPAQEFENLGSAIAFAGVNAVATEEQILSVTKEIATTAKMAKFSSADIVGLSTALSSLGIAPEAARGSIIRTFAGINKAISEGGDVLERYASVAGMSAESFAATWQENGQEGFSALLRGLQNLSDEGANLDTVLRELGMKNVRDIQTVQKLGDNYAVYANSLRDANQGFKEGTFLGEAYGVIQETVASKLAIVSNSFSNLLDTLGQGAVGDVFKSILDGVNELLIKLNQFAKTPIGKTLSGIVIVAAGVIASIAAINAVSALASASLKAFATAQSSLIGTSAGASAAVATMNTQLTATAAAGNAGAVGLNKMKIAAAAAMTALKFVGAVAALGLVISALDMIAQRFTSVQDKADNLLGGFSGLQDAITADLDAYNSALSDFGGDTRKAAEATGVVRGLSAELENNNSEINKTITAQNSLNNLVGLGSQNTRLLSEDIETMNFVLGENTVAWIANSIAQSDAFQEMSKNSGVMQSLAESGFNLRDALAASASGREDEYFASLEMNVNKNTGAFEAFVFGLDATYQSSRAASESTNIFTASMGNLTVSLVDNFLPLLRFIQTVAKLIGLDLTPTITAFENMKNGVAGAAAQVLILGPGLSQANNQLASGNADKYASQLDKVKDSARGASRALRTVVDYANDLRGVFSRAFEITFGRQEAIDEIASGWNNIAQKADTARDAIRKANAEIAELGADRSILAYQLTVAERYGDEQRAAVIRAKIAKIDNNVADKKKDIADATADLTLSTEGNTDAAIENRDVLRNQVTSYAAYIATLVATGLKGKALETKIKELKDEFIKNGIAAGFSNEALKPYVKTFDDMGIVANNIPANVDIKFNSNISAALQAVNEYLGKLKKASGTFTSTVKVVLPAPGSLKMIIDPSDLRLYRMGLEKGHLDTKQFYKAVYGIDLKNFAAGGFVSGPGTGTSDSIPAMLSNGEYVVKASAVGAYGVDFLNALNQQKVGSFGSTTGAVASSQGSTVAYLSPEDRALLRSAIDRPVNLYTENAKIASSANAGNVVLAQRGTN